MTPNVQFLIGITYYRVGIGFKSIKYMSYLQRSLYILSIGESYKLYNQYFFKQIKTTVHSY